jgi:hypothetical protein
MRAELEAFAPDVIGPVAEAVAEGAPISAFIRLDPTPSAGQEDLDRLCGDGAHRQGRRGARRLRLVGHRRLGAVWDLSPKDEAGNAVSGRGYALRAATI